MESSKLTTKYQATIPKAVRRRLKLGAGDRVAFEIDGEVVRLHKATPLDIDFARAVGGTLSEWSGEADDEAYRDL